jgi:hypothetical protein
VVELPLRYLNGFCQECGAHIYPNRQGKHNLFHAKFDELVDWAQSVSQLFIGPESDSGRDKQADGFPIDREHESGDEILQQIERRTAGLQEGPSQQNEMEI